MSLVEDGTLDLETTARSVLGDDLPLIDDDVTIEHLLAHRSGIGDYLDEDAGRRGHRLRDAGPRPRARLDRGLPRRARRVPHGLPAGRAVRVLQRWLRRARADRRAGERCAVPRARADRVCEPAGMVDTGVPALGRAPGRRRARLPDRRRPEDERVPPAGARQRRRRDLLDGGGPERVLASALGRAHRASGTGGRDGAAAQRSRRTGRNATGSGSGCTRRRTSCGSRATTPACRSTARTTP